MILLINDEPKVLDTNKTEKKTSGIGFKRKCSLSSFCLIELKYYNSKRFPINGSTSSKLQKKKQNSNISN